jgi:hypothetical protein
MTIWQYRIVDLDYPAAGEAENAANALGADGWELVAVVNRVFVDRHRPRLQLFFKRLVVQG